MGRFLSLFVLLATSTIPGLALPRSCSKAHGHGYGYGYGYGYVPPSGSNGTPPFAPSKSFPLPVPIESGPVNPSSSASEPIFTTFAGPSTTPTPSPSQPASNTTTSPSDIQAFLDGHNTLRAQHGAAPLTWNTDLATKAQQWADNCVFVHSKGELGPYGENLAAGTGPDYDIPAALKSWSDEAPSYDPKNPVASHFTQMVWKSTTEIGCGVAICTDGKIFDVQKFGNTKMLVCEYKDAGNVEGEYSDNVQV